MTQLLIGLNIFGIRRVDTRELWKCTKKMITVLWSIWTHRNSVFRNHRRNLVYVIEMGRKVFDETFSHNKDTSLINPTDIACSNTTNADKAFKVRS